MYEKRTNNLVEIPGCLIHCKRGEEVFHQLKDLPDLRHVLIKTAVNTGEVLVIFVSREKPTEELKKIAEKLDVDGVICNINKRDDNVILGREYIPICGKERITEELNGYTFIVSPASFFQVNTPQAEAIYQKIVDLADLTGEETVLDAYCGVGTISLLLAKHAKKVTGIEWVQQAIDDAHENASLNKIENVEFICADAAKKITPADVVILNPPRKGCAEELLQKVIQSKPKKILYLSCDPATLARDLAILKSGGYSLDSVTPYDMFPQTSHVETLVKLNLL